MNNNQSNLQNSNTQSNYDVALRQYFGKIYNYMGFGLLVTALVAYFTASSPTLLQAIYGTPLKLVVMLAPLAFVLVLSFGVNKLQASTAQLLFWLFAGTMGLSLSSIFLVYTGASIVKAFLITGVTFLVMSIYGYSTNKDLSQFGTILLMGLVGIIIASIVNIFTKSSGLELLISFLGVIIFTGLIAYNTQRLKVIFNDGWNTESAKKAHIMGALSLYLDFINLFLMLLRLMGQRR